MADPAATGALGGQEVYMDRQDLWRDYPEVYGGNMSIRDGEWEDGLEAFTLLHSRNEAEPYFLNRRAFCLTALERWTEALADAQAALEMDPENDRYRREVGLAAYGAGEWRTALKALERALDAPGFKPEELTQMKAAQKDAMDALINGR